MGQVTGLVQQVKYNPLLDVAFIWVGPTSTNTTLYYVLRRYSDDEPQASIKESMIDALTAAMFNRRAVILTTSNSVPQEIISAQINPV